jgi:hypothetical protein
MFPPAGFQIIIESGSPEDFHLVDAYNVSKDQMNVGLLLRKTSPILAPPFPARFTPPLPGKRSGCGASCPEPLSIPTQEKRWLFIRNPLRNKSNSKTQDLIVNESARSGIDTRRPEDDSLPGPDFAGVVALQCLRTLPFAVRTPRSNQAQWCHIGTGQPAKRTISLCRIRANCNGSAPL